MSRERSSTPGLLSTSIMEAGACCEGISVDLYVAEAVDGVASLFTGELRRSRRAGSGQRGEDETMIHWRVWQIHVKHSIRHYRTILDTVRTRQTATSPCR